jgi:hypothetical protein
MPRVECPKCEAVLEVEELGSSAQCPNCESVFLAFVGTEIKESCDPKGIARFLAGIYEPVDGQERAWLISEAKWLVKKPAVGLMVTGFLGIAGTTTIGLLAILSEVEDIQRGWGRPESIPFQIGVVIAFNFYCFLIVAGGRSLKRLEQRGFCFAAATLAMFSAVPFGAWLLLSIPAVIFSSWSFAALHNPVVKHAMHWIRQDKEDRGQV